MIFRKTTKSQRYRFKTQPKNKYNDDTHMETHVTEIFWFLIIPVYKRSQIIKSQLFN